MVDIHSRYHSTHFTLGVKRIRPSALCVIGKHGKLTDLLGASALDQREKASPIY